MNLVQELDMFDPYELKRKQIKTINMSDEMNMAMMLESNSTLFDGKISFYISSNYVEKDRVLQIFLKYKDRIELATLRFFTLSEIKTLFYHHFPEVRKLFSLRDDRNDCQVYIFLQRDPKHQYQLLEDEDVQEVSFNDIIEFSYVL